MLLMLAISALGDIDIVRCAGEGVDSGDPWLDACSLSDRAFVRAVAALGPRAKASCVSLTDSSMVPEWWF
jgi:hypothetical protein